MSLSGVTGDPKKGEKAGELNLKNNTRFLRLPLGSLGELASLWVGCR